MEHDLMFAYAGILLSAVVPIHLGSWDSVKPPKKARHATSGDHPLDEDDDDDEIESITWQDALLFPVIASIVLASLYVAFKYYKNLVNQILDLNCAGCLGLARMLMHLTRRYMSTSRQEHTSRYRLLLEESKAALPLMHVKFTRYDVACLVVSLATSFASHYTKHWMLANLFGTVYSFNAISLLRLDSFKTGIILLFGLFVYDIFFVFYTPVMISVAQDFEAPVKMVMPKSLSDTTVDAGFAMLGLGDIVFPGIFVALSLRFDHFMARQKDKLSAASKSTSTPYYRTCLVAYCLGLVLTIAVMHTYKAAQPALLYLTPACVLSVLLCALFRGEVKALWSFTESEGTPHEHSDLDVNAAAVQGGDAPRNVEQKLREKTPPLQANQTIEMPALTSEGAQVDEGRVLRRRKMGQ